MSECHFYCFHGGAARSGTDQPDQIEQNAAQQMSQQDRFDGSGHSQRGQQGAGQYFCNRDTGAKPQRSIIEK